MEAPAARGERHDAETFSYEKVEGKLLDNLKDKLAPHVSFKPVATDQLFNTLAEMGQVDAFTQTIGTFLRHFKSSGATIARFEARAASSEDVPRSRSFLKIFDALIDAYEARLGDMIDFEDMIVRATTYVETSRYKSPYRHILVDEFQDISKGRGRLLRALKAQHEDARLFAVGDDWQSIYRFTGADIHLMRNFGAEFGGKFAGNNAVHSTVDLGRTFRSVDKIAHPARPKGFEPLTRRFVACRQPETWLLTTRLLACWGRCSNVARQLSLRRQPAQRSINSRRLSRISPRR